LKNEIDFKPLAKKNKKKKNETFVYFEVKRRNVFGFNNAQQWKETHGQNARDRHWYALGDPIGR
jgi:hypothetical protein